MGGASPTTREQLGLVVWGALEPVGGSAAPAALSIVAATESEDTGTPASITADGLRPSRMIVTGPSLTGSTSIRAPKTPGLDRDAELAQRRAEAARRAARRRSGGAAAVKLGRFPLRRVGEQGELADHERGAAGVEQRAVEPAGVVLEDAQPRDLAGESHGVLLARRRPRSRAARAGRIRSRRAASPAPTPTRAKPAAKRPSSLVRFNLIYLASRPITGQEWKPPHIPGPHSERFSSATAPSRSNSSSRRSTRRSRRASVSARSSSTAASSPPHRCPASSPSSTSSRSSISSAKESTSAPPACFRRRLHAATARSRCASSRTAPCWSRSTTRPTSWLRTTSGSRSA